MPSTAQQQKRAEQARINGAKSKGATTPEGQAKARTASLQHGLYATEATLHSTIDQTQYAELRAHYHSVWAPENAYIADKVDDLVSYRWELNRLREVRRQQMAEAFADLRTVVEAEIYANDKRNIFEKLDLRIRRCNMELSRIERDLVRLTKHFKSSGASHKPLKTNEVQPQMFSSYPETRSFPTETMPPTVAPVASEPPN
ncbi:MAG: hypothetical protein JNM66_13260 [Bryobacterales bacterium]|nr:hypothetical protein [Bryobacterales bacterium]